MGASYGSHWKLDESHLPSDIKHIMRLDIKLRAIARSPQSQQGITAIKKLLDAGAAVDAPDTRGATSLLIAASTGSPACKATTLLCKTSKKQN